MKQKIFISYSDKDKNKMRSLEKTINSTKIFLPIIIADNRKALMQLTQKVIEGIKCCDYFIPILTGQSISTQWINQEIGFAAALEKKIIPLVESQIMDELRGFIHKQLDLSYTFEGNKDSLHSEASKFSYTAKTLINDLLIDNNVTPTNLTLENLFPGKWRSEFILNNKAGSDPEIEIKEGNKYFAIGKHWFNVDEVSVDIDSNILIFRKVGLQGDNRKLLNNLKIIELGKRYEGFENEIPIKYYKIIS